MEQTSTSSRRTTVVLAVLLLANVCNFIDRQLPYILAEQIRHDLHLTDTQLGLLGGAAFAVIYAILAIPLASLADRHGGRWVLSGCILIWSLATSIGGLARNFTQLGLSRCGVAIGEAGCTPVAHAVIAAQYPAGRRSFPIAIFSLGVPFGTMLGLVLGGWLGAAMSWRIAFFAVSIPGVLLALLCSLLLPDRQAQIGPGEEAPASIRDTLRHVAADPVLRHIFCALTVLNMGAYALISFSPSFYQRSFGLSVAQVGLALGLVHGVAGTIGALSGGWTGDALGGRDQRWRMWVPAIGIVAAIPFTIGALLAGNLALSIVCFAVPKLANLLYLGPSFATVQARVPARMRASASATMYFGMGLIGMSLGPLVVGMASDHLRPIYGGGALKLSLLLVTITQAWSAWHFHMAARHLGRGA